MRMTELAQRWTDKRGTWYLTSEEERGGDPGLLAELTPRPNDGPALRAARLALPDEDHLRAVIPGRRSRRPQVAVCGTPIATGTSACSLAGSAAGAALARARLLRRRLTLDGRPRLGALVAQLLLRLRLALVHLQRVTSIELAHGVAALHEKGAAVLP